jgi:imidazolonepropionase
MKLAELIVFTNILVTCAGNGKPKTGSDLKDVSLIRDAGVVVNNGIIEFTGKREDITSVYKGGTVIEAGRKPVLPGFVDSHTHPIFAGNRVEEFILRAGGATYQQIHAAGGGIQHTVDRTREATDEELYLKAKAAIMRMLRHGTTTIEAKSGYGLDTEEELRELRILKKLSRDLPVNMVTTFLGAHAIPREYSDKREEYIKLLVEEMIPAVRKENLADFVDAFCEEGAFTREETGRILEAAKLHGFKLKLHAEEFTNQGSAVMAGQMGAVSVDHLLRLTDEDIDSLAKTDTILTLMPGTLFNLNMKEYAPAWKIIEKGAKIALATDYNAGSCMSESMQMAVSLACIKMAMTPDEALNAATYNASFAVGMNEKVGSIEPGKQADMIIFDIDDYRLIPYHFGVNLAETVIRSGKIVEF